MTARPPAEQPAPAVTVFGVMASLLDSMDRPLLVSDRIGTILFANVHAQDRLASSGLPSTDRLNLFRDLLSSEARDVFGQLESGEQEVSLQVSRPGLETRVRVRWLPEPDWLVTSIEPVPAAAPAGEVEMRQTVQDLMQEREITYRNLLAAYLRLQEVNRQKTVFLASAAHELKTPLAVIKGYYDLLLSGSLGKLNDKQRDILQESKESCERLVRLVSMFLNYSTLESGKLVLHLRENDLRDCLSELATRWHEAFVRKHVRLDTILNTDIPIFKFDYQKVQQTVANLLDNSLKHTPAGGNVTFRAEVHFWE